MKVRYLLAMLLLSTAVFGETRFGRQVVSLSKPKSFQYFKVDAIAFPYLEKNGVSVSCLTYRGSEYYYVEVAVSNKRSGPIRVNPADFVNLVKPGYTVLMASTLEAAARRLSLSSKPFTPTSPPSPTRTTSTTTGTATPHGNTDSIDAPSTSPSLREAAAKNPENALNGEQNLDLGFGQYLQEFAHEIQNGLIEAGEVRTFMFTFHQLVPKKAKFDVQVLVGADQFIFSYKE